MYKKTDHRNVELTEVGPRFELKREFEAESHVWGREARLAVPGLMAIPACSVHDPPGHAGAGGHSRRGVALAPLHQYCTQEGLPERRVSPLTTQAVDLELRMGLSQTGLRSWDAEPWWVESSE